MSDYGEEVLSLGHPSEYQEGQEGVYEQLEVSCMPTVCLRPASTEADSPTPRPASLHLCIPR